MAVGTSIPGARVSRGWHIGGSVVVIGYLLWVLVPIATVTLNSFKPTTAIFTERPNVRFSPILEHYRGIFEDGKFIEFLQNSAVVAIGTTTLALTLGTPAAYALARLPMRGRELWSRFFLVTRMVPAVALVVPMFIIAVRTGLKGTLFGLVLAHTSFTLPLVIWMMRSFFAELPLELEEAALVDGTTRFGAFWRIALPLTLPGLTATAILVMLFSWNEFLFALILSGPDTQTMPVGMASFIGTVSIDWGGSSAAAVIAMLPVFVLGLAVQRFLVRGLTMGAVKG